MGEVRRLKDGKKKKRTENGKELSLIEEVGACLNTAAILYFAALGIKFAITKDGRLF